MSHLDICRKNNFEEGTNGISLCQVFKMNRWGGLISTPNVQTYNDPGIVDFRLKVCMSYSSFLPSRSRPKTPWVLDSQ